MGSDDVEKLRAGFLNLAGGDEDFRGLTLGAAEGLVDEHAGVRQGAALAFLSGAEKHGAHAGGHTRANGSYVGLHQLHGVVDAQAAVHLATGGVQVQGDIGMGILRSQEQQLGLDDVGHIVVDGHAQKDDAVHHQAAEHVHLGHVQFALFRDGGVDVSVHGGRITRKGHRTDAPSLHCEFIEFCHYLSSLNLSWEIFLVWRVTSSRTLAMAMLSSHCSSRRRYWFWS